MTEPNPAAIAAIAADLAQHTTETAVDLASETTEIARVLAEERAILAAELAKEKTSIASSLAAERTRLAAEVEAALEKQLRRFRTEVRILTGGTFMLVLMLALGKI